MPKTLITRDNSNATYKFTRKMPAAAIAGVVVMMTTNIIHFIIHRIEHSGKYIMEVTLTFTSNYADFNDYYFSVFCPSSYVRQCGQIPGI